MHEQGSPEWFADRCGRVTASRISDVMMKPSTAGFQNYKAQLICERLTGSVAESFTSTAMQWGTDTEPRARAFYELESGVTVEQTGMVPHPTLEMSGASPDGLVGDMGLVEIKCPNTATHLNTLLGGEINKKYVLQMQWQMECTGREWCDFVSFDPRVPFEMQMHVERVKADSEMQSEIRQSVESFLNATAVEVETLRAKYMSEAA